MTTTLVRTRKEVNYDKEGNFEMVAANPSVDYLSSTHRAWRIELRERVNQESPANLAGLYCFWSLREIALDVFFDECNRNNKCEVPSL